MISRRSFLKATLATTAVAAGASSGCGNDVRAAPIIDVTVDDDPKSFRYGQIAVELTKYPDLAARGGALTLRLAALPPGDRPFRVPSRGVLLVHLGTSDDPREFIATRSDCPHQGCPLGYSAKDGQIECPCHGSRFRAVADTNDTALCVGLVTHKPARSNLDVYGATRIGDVVYVDLNEDVSCDVLNRFPSVEDGKITIPIAQYPGLSMVGGSLTGRTAGLDQSVLVARVADDRVIAVSSVCTHMQQSVQLEIGEGRLHCYEHDSLYTYEGVVICAGLDTGCDPAKAAKQGNLKRFEVEFDGATIVITV